MLPEFPTPQAFSMAKSVYKNLVQPAADESVMRYTSLADLVLLLTRNELPLIRVDMFRDPFEGSIPQSVVNQRLLIQAGRNAQQFQNVIQNHQIRHIQVVTLGQSPPPWMEMVNDVHSELSRKQKARIKSTYASCWRCGPESEGMWRLYCGEKEGVVLKTTFAKLDYSIKDQDVLAGMIRYGNYKTMAPFDDDFDHVMCKREGFNFERELRLLMTDVALYNQILVNESLEPAKVQLLPWSVGETIDQILVSPYANDLYFEAVRSAVASIDANKTGLVDRVDWSELQQKPVF